MSMRRPLFIVVIAASAVTLTGCSLGAFTGGASPAPSNRGRTDAPSASAPAPAASSGSGNSTGAVDICQAVPLAAVNAATGRTYTAAESATAEISGVPVSGCTYHDGDIAAGTDEIVLDIQVFHGGDPRGVFAYQESSVDQTDEMTDLSGIGDSAQLGLDELDVAWGHDVVAVIDALRPGDMSPLTRDAFESIATQVHQATSN